MMITYLFNSRFDCDCQIFILLITFIVFIYAIIMLIKGSIKWCCDQLLACKNVLVLLLVMFHGTNPIQQLIIRNSV